jgi:YggT family protein
MPMLNLFEILGRAIDLIVALIFVRIVISWINPRAMMFPKQPLKLLFDITEPLMRLVRGIVPPVGMFDFSPVLLLMGLGLLRQVCTMLSVSTSGF